MYLPKILFLLFFSILTRAAFSSCNYPDFNDPDEFFDNLGRTKFCFPDDTSSPRDHSLKREDLGGGFTTSNGGNSAEGGRAVVIADGGITYVAGRTLGANNDFLIYKYFADGSLDTSFDTDGKATHSFGSGDDWAHGIALQTNGRIVVAGRSDSGSAGNFDFAVLRLGTTGNLDTSFSTTGKKVIAVGSSVDIARAVVVQTDGMILLAGYGKNTNYDNAFARLTTGGALDTTFSTDGKALFANGSNDNAALSVAVDSDGSIVGSGNSYNGSDWDLGLVRLVSSGALDTTFRTTGKLTYTLRGTVEESSYGVAVDPTNKIIAVGMTDPGNGDVVFGAARFLTSGNFDTTFNTTGGKRVPTAGGDERAYGVALETSGNSIVFAGYSTGSNIDFAVVRLLSNANFDTSFATTGRLVQPILAGEDRAQAIAMKGDGVIMVAGRSDTGGGAFDFALLRLGSDGSPGLSGMPVKSFGTSGLATFDFSGTVDLGYGITGDTSGRIILAGQNDNNSNNFMVVRALPSGVFDTSFSTDGKTEWNGSGNGADVARKATVQPDGKIIVAGTVFFDDGMTFGIDYAVARFHTDGSFDTSFKTSGKDEVGQAAISGAGAYSVALMTTGEVVMAGKGGDLTAIFSVRVTSDGALDTSYATDGSASFNPYPQSAVSYGALDSNQSIVVFSGGSANKTTLVRWVTTGALDTAFLTIGYKLMPMGGTAASTYVATGGQGMALTSSDAIVTAYVMDTSGANFPITMNKVLSDGVFDTSFQTTGKFIVNSVPTSGGGWAKAVVTTPNDKIYLQWEDGSDFRIERFTTDGRFDTAFATDGGIASSFGATDTPAGATILKNGWFCGVGTAVGTDIGVSCVWQ